MMRLRNLFLAILMVGCATVAQGQKVLKCEFDTTTADFTMVVEYQGKSKAELFNAAKEWITSNVTDYQQKRITEDAASGTIKYSCTANLYSVKPFHNYQIPMKGHFSFAMAVTTKDGRFRIRTSNCQATWQEQMFGKWGQVKTLPAIKFALWSEDGKCMSGVGQAVDALANGILSATKNAKADDDF